MVWQTHPVQTTARRRQSIPLLSDEFDPALERVTVYELVFDANTPESTLTTACGDNQLVELRS